MEKNITNKKLKLCRPDLRFKWVCMTLEYAVGLLFIVLFINILTKVDFMISSKEY